MPAADLLLSSSRVLTPAGLRPATVVVAGGRIVDVAERVDGVPPEDHPTAERVDAGDLVVLPGLVDSHVHVNEPGRTHWEGFRTATRAAAAGGVTTIVDMPLNCLPPTTDVTALNVKRAAAAPAAFVDIAFWGGAVPANAAELAPLHRAGVRGFKAFLCDSGVPEYGSLDPADLVAVLRSTHDLGTTLIVHAEDPEACAAAAATAEAQTRIDPRRYAAWLDRRPALAEVRAVQTLVDACRRTGGRVHVLHVSAAGAGEVVAEAKAEGLPITAETCPHYLTLHAEAVPDGATAHKCAPPIRERGNADRLWGLLADGTLDAVVSDHSPCPPEDKDLEDGDFLEAWGGIASLQLGLPLVWTEARRRGHDLADVVRWMASGPAGIAGLAGKGVLAPGADADLVLFDPDTTWPVDGAALEHRHPVTPYHGREVTGRVVATFLRGVQIVRDGLPVGPPTGQLR